MSPIVRPAGLSGASGSAGAVSGTGVDSSGSTLRIDATLTPDATEARLTICNSRRGAGAGATRPAATRPGRTGRVQSSGNPCRICALHVHSGAEPVKPGLCCQRQPKLLTADWRPSSRMRCRDNRTRCSYGVSAPASFGATPGGVEPRSFFFTVRRPTPASRSLRSCRTCRTASRPPSSPTTSIR